MLGFSFYAPLASQLLLWIEKCFCSLTDPGYCCSVGVNMVLEWANLELMEQQGFYLPNPVLNMPDENDCSLEKNFSAQNLLLSGMFLTT